MYENKENNIRKEKNPATNPPVKEENAKETKIETNNKINNKRCTIELTNDAKMEVDRIRKTFNLTMSEVFRFALVLMRIYADSTIQRKEVHIVDPNDPSVVRVVELPLFYSRSKK